MKLSPSLFAADPARMGEAIAAVEPFADSFHLDVMDGRFAPAFGLSIAAIERIVTLTDRPVDLHLMIDDPAEWALKLTRLHPRSTAFQIETVADAAGLCKALRAAGTLPFVACQPGTAARPVAGSAGTLLLLAPAGGEGAFGPAPLARSRPPGGLMLDGKLDAARIQALPPLGVETQVVVGGAIFDDPDPGAAARRLAELLHQSEDA